MSDRSRGLSGRLLIVDDEPTLLRSLARVLRPLGVEVETATDGVEAAARLGAAAYDLCITDLRMPHADGFEVLRRANACRPRVPVVVLTGHGTITTAVEAMRAGAANFLTKPFSLAEVEAVVRDLLDAARAGPRRPDDGDGARPAAPAAVFIGEDPAVRALLELVARVADTDSTILVTGESGTGKEVLARVIHATSARAARPFVALNCAAIPESLMESELFGHVRGAFTGAVSNHRGRFAEAEGGTLFLDEIAELAAPLQAKLLRVLQEREYSPVGESRSVHADVRIVAATNADLERAVADGRFRADLFYRLNVIALEVPPLRRRPADIPVLADHLLGRLNHRLRRRVDGFTAEALECLVRYGWPGNVRELENVIERAVAIRGEGRITLADLPPRLTAPAAPAVPAALPAAGLDLKHALEDAEERLIRQALEQTGGNKNQAAARLGMNRTTLVEKLKRFGRRRSPRR
jgi:DNA-binding NtrC family response regulator